eukprot:5366849-Amphidinium_carterae.1
MINILKKKKLLLLTHVLQLCGYHDVEVVDDMLAGFALVGRRRKSAAFPPKLKPASMSVEGLRRATAWRRKSLVSLLKPSDEPGLDVEVWDATMAEVKE